MSDNMVENVVIIMCKAPIEGKVKTRLMTTYTAQQAMQLHQAMATTVIQRAKRLFKHVWLAVDDIQHPFFKPFDLPLYAQGVGDLGERMSGLMLKAIQKGHENILFLGTDSPHMLDSRLIEAFEALNNHDVVFGAVEDGGYDCIGMKGSHPELFLAIDWGTEIVLKQSLSIAEQHHLHCCVLEESFDVDTPDMLQRAQKMGWKVSLSFA